MSGTQPSTRTSTGVPVVLVGLTLVVVSLAVDLAWLLTPWTPAPGPPVDPTAGLDPDLVARGSEVAAAQRLPGLLSLSLGVGAIAAVVLSGPGRRLLLRLARLRGGPLVRVGSQVLLLVAVHEVVRWPFGMWAESVRRDAGLSVRSWAGFTRDRLVGIGLESLLLLVAVLVLVALAHVLPRWWPAVAAAGAALLVVTVSLLYPVLVEPAFAEHTPLPEGPLRTQVEALAEQAGVPLRDVVVSDASSRTTTLNASVSGLGPTRRVVLRDTLVDGLPPEQVLVVVAHELGHVARQDVARGTAIGALGAAAAVLVLGLLLSSSRVRRATGGGRLGQASSVGLLVLALTVAQVLATPVESLLSRQVERAADEFALTLTQDPGAFVATQQALAERNLGDPSPPRWVQWWFGTHPTTAERVAVGQRAGG